MSEQRFDVAGLFAQLTRLSREEIIWTFQRMKQLLKEGKSREEAKAIVIEEVKDEPWTKTTRK